MDHNVEAIHVLHGQVFDVDGRCKDLVTTTRGGALQMEKARDYLSRAMDALHRAALLEEGR